MIAQGDVWQLARVLEGLPVLGCVDGHAAASAGIRYGDVLLVVNGQRTRTFADYLVAKQLHSTRMQVRLFRDGREVELEIELGHTPPASAESLNAIARERLPAAPALAARRGQVN